MNDQTSHPPLAQARPADLERSGKLLRATLWLYILGTVATMGLYKPIAFYGVDYDKHWYAARALLEGKSLYVGGTMWMGFNYPQAAAMPFVWLGWFPVGVGEYLWKAVLLLLTVGCWWVAWRHYRPVVPAEASAGVTGLVRAGIARHWGLLSAFMVSAYYAITSCIYLGNIDPVNAILAVGMVGALLSGAPLAAGVIWGMLTLVKMMPVALVVPVLIWRQWRVLQGFMIVMAVYFFTLAALGRVGEEWLFVKEAIPGIPVWWRYISISPVAFVLRNIGPVELMHNPHGFTLVTRWCEVGFLAAYLTLALMMRRRRIEWLRALEAAIVFYPIFSPLLEFHHFVWIMPVLFLQARRFAMGGLGVGTACALLIGWALLCSTYHIVDLAPHTNSELVHFAALPGYMIVLTVTLWDTFRSAGRGMESATGASPAALSTSTILG